MALSAALMLIFFWLAHQLFVLWWSKRDEQHISSLLWLAAFLVTSGICEAVWYWVDGVLWYRVCRGISAGFGLGASFYLPFLITHLAKFASVKHLSESNRALSCTISALSEKIPHG